MNVFIEYIILLFCCFSELNHTNTPKTCNLIHIKGGIYAGYLGKQIFVPGKMSSDHVKMFCHSIHHINQIHIHCSLYMTCDSTVNTVCTLGCLSIGSSHTWQRVSANKYSAFAWQKKFSDTVFKICGRPRHFIFIKFVPLLLL